MSRTKILLGLLVTAVLVAGLLNLMRPARRQPHYRGKSLTQWLKQLDNGQAFGISSAALPTPTAAQSQAANAIRAIGQEALPLLMHDLHVSPAPDSFRFRARDLLNRILSRTLGTQVYWGEVSQEDRIRWRAAQGLAALGPVAAPAVPELKRLLCTNYFHSAIKEAAYVLAAVGPEGVAILTNAVRVNEWSGMCAIWALGQHPAAGTNVVPFLIQATTSPSEGTACGAIQVLGLFHVDAETVVPALVAALSSSDSAVRRDAVQALGRYGAQAISSVPQLERLTNDPAVSGNALKALQRIQPNLD